MRNPFRLFVAEQDGQEIVFTPEMLEGLDAEAIARAFGETGTWHTITFHPATFARQEEAKRQALKPHETLGFVVDPLLLPLARAKVMIAAWTLGEPVGDLSGLSPVLANTIDVALQQWMYPTALNHPGFIAALQSRAQPAAEAA